MDRVKPALKVVDGKPSAGKTPFEAAYEHFRLDRWATGSGRTRCTTATTWSGHYWPGRPRRAFGASRTFPWGVRHYRARWRAGPRGRAAT